MALRASPTYYTGPALSAYRPMSTRRSEFAVGKSPAGIAVCPNLMNFSTEHR